MELSEEQGRGGKQEQLQEAALRELAKGAESTFWGMLGCEYVGKHEEEYVISLDAEGRHLNGIGIVHGGVLSSLLDNVMGIAAMAARPGEKVVTTHLQVSFVAPLHEGKLIAKAVLLHQTGKTLTAQGTVVSADGKLGTIGMATFRVI